MRERASESADKPTCGRCGVYRHLHPTKFGCEKPRLSFWWDRHYVRRHIAGRLWLALSDKRRWQVVIWLYGRRPHLCWCDFVDAALLDDKREGYRDDPCDVPLPTDAKEPRYGWCYCVPDEVVTSPGATP